MSEVNGQAELAASAAGPMPEAPAGQRPRRKIEFSPNEREVLEEAWGEYARVVALICRLHGVRLSPDVLVASDRSGIFVQE